MWFLYFYLISVGVCLFILLLTTIASAKKLKREYPEITIKKKNKRSFAEILCNLLPYFIPFLNLIFILVTILTINKTITEIVKQTMEENK